MPVAVRVRVLLVCTTVCVRVCVRVLHSSSSSPAAAAAAAAATAARRTGPERRQRHAVSERRRLHTAVVICSRAAAALILCRGRGRVRGRRGRRGRRCDGLADSDGAVAPPYRRREVSSQTQVPLPEENAYARVVGHLPHAQAVAIRHELEQLVRQWGLHIMQAGVHLTLSEQRGVVVVVVVLVLLNVRKVHPRQPRPQQVHDAIPKGLQVVPGRAQAGAIAPVIHGVIVQDALLGGGQAVA